MLLSQVLHGDKTSVGLYNGDTGVRAICQSCRPAAMQQRVKIHHLRYTDHFEELMDSGHAP